MQIDILKICIGIHARIIGKLLNVFLFSSIPIHVFNSVSFKFYFQQSLGARGDSFIESGDFVLRGFSGLRLRLYPTGLTTAEDTPASVLVQFSLHSRCSQIQESPRQRFIFRLQNLLKLKCISDVRLSVPWSCDQLMCTGVGKTLPSNSIFIACFHQFSHTPYTCKFEE
jgi:hypothetical protein